MGETKERYFFSNARARARPQVVLGDIAFLSIIALWHGTRKHMDNREIPSGMHTLISHAR